MLEVGKSYKGTVKKINYAVNQRPHHRANHKIKYFHSLEVLVDKEKFLLQVDSNEEKNAHCNINDIISFRVKNFHEGNNNYYCSILPPGITTGMMEAIGDLDGKTNITGSITERALSLAVAYLQYQTDPTADDLFVMADMIFGYMGSRLKMEGFI